MRFAVWLLCLRTALAATYYVAPHGSDDGPGNAEQPWAQISTAASRAGPGDVIILRDGVYGSEGRSSGFPVRIKRAGFPDAWIVIKAEHKGQAILDCRVAPAGAPSGCNGYIYLDSGAAYWVFDGLVFRGGDNFGISANSTPAAHDILVRGCRFEDIGRRANDSIYGEAGVYVGQGSTNFTFDGNTFHDIGRTSGQYPSNDHGLYLHSSDTSIVNNIFYAPISGWGIQTAVGFSGLIAYNTFVFPMRNSGGQLILWGDNPAITIRNNIFYNPGGSFAINTSSLRISGGCSVDHNVITGGLPGFAPGCFVGDNIRADAGLVNVLRPPYDFHLRPGSPAIDAGAPVPSVTTDFDGAPRTQGEAPDIGAFEFPSRASHAVPTGPGRAPRVDRRANTDPVQ